MSGGDQPQLALRSANDVMRLARMGSAFPTRLSFMRILVRALHKENSKVTRPVWQMDDAGFGRAVYSLKLGGNTYSLVAFSTALKPEHRTDRVIAEAWDASFALFDGVPTDHDLARLESTLPRQEAGRFQPSELVISRANKSVRLFDHVVAQLSGGLQPEAQMIKSVGYLMRTTAVYGNGKFGFADRCCIGERAELAGSFQAEMLTVWLIRGFTHDLVEHIARARNPAGFVPLSNDIKKSLGIGNATGLGMAPFLIKHAVLLNNWVMTREIALARVRAIVHAPQVIIDQVQGLITRAQKHISQWRVADERQSARIGKLKTELAELAGLVTPEWLANENPWNRLINHSSIWSLECQELIIALVLEPHGALIDDLGTRMVDNTGLRLTPGMTVGELMQLLEANYQWALAIDFTKPGSVKYFWYVSEEKLEPRFGVRGEEPGSELETPLDIARQAKALHGDLIGVEQTQTSAKFLLTHPQHRHIVRRVQATKHYPYTEIRDNLIGEDCLPLDILRYKLSFFGASKCDPKSNLWTRINMYQGAPLACDLCRQEVDDWWLPVLGLQDAG